MRLDSDVEPCYILIGDCKGAYSKPTDIVCKTKGCRFESGRVDAGRVAQLVEYINKRTLSFLRLSDKLVENA